jgi:DNA-binding response OmpR family regulator
MSDSNPESAWEDVLTAPPIHKPPRVLVAEDDAAMRRIVVETLQKDGYAVSEVPDGGRLLVTLARGCAHKDGAELVDLLVTDVRMPVCTGLQILEQLRAVHCPLPIILMTAFGDEATRRKARTLGAMLLDKPFDVEALRVAATRLLRGPTR